MNVIDKLRAWFKIDKPEALSITGWSEWEENLKKTRPVAFFVTEVVFPMFGRISYLVANKPRRAFYYLRNRYIYKTHLLQTGLSVGHLHSISAKLMHGLFQALVDYVEIDKAISQLDYEKSAGEKYKIWIKDYEVIPPRIRNVEKGLEYMRWEMQNSNDDISKNASEAMLLYQWWTKVRPNRGEVFDLAGLTEIQKRLYDKYGDGYDSRPKVGIGTLPAMTSTEAKELDDAYERCYALEADYDREDEEMLIRLIKLRKGLWE